MNTMSSWVKTLNLEKELLLDQFTLANHFKHVANVIRNQTSKKVIAFEPVCSKKEWKQRNEWIYIFTINDRIVKIGGTRTGLAGRTTSYLCGHFTQDRGLSGKCSVTNAYMYNTFDHYIHQGNHIKMYGFVIPDVKVDVDVWGNKKVVNAQVYTAFETAALEQYKKQTGNYPQLSDNSDPTHR